jgi:Protein of unknown function (DUF2934)
VCLEHRARRSADQLVGRFLCTRYFEHLKALGIRRNFQKSWAPKSKRPPCSKDESNNAALPCKNPMMKKPLAPVRTMAEANLQEEIRLRASKLYEERGREDGHDVEDWLRAEAEITGRTKEVAA